MNAVYIFNPESGNGKIKKNKEYIISKLSEKFDKIDIMPTMQPKDATTFAKDACGKYDYILVSGGDGTLNEVVNGIATSENKPIVGYIPTGTVNDVARSLGISRNIKKAVQTILMGEVFEHDIFRVNSAYGIYVCCAGLFTSSSYETKRSAKKKLGKIAYFFKGVKDIFGAKPVKVVLKTEDETISQNCALVLVHNSKSVAGIKLNKNAKLDDGEVEVVLVKASENRVRLCEIARVLDTFTLGVEKCKNSKHIIYRKLSHFVLQTQKDTIINLDGEKSEAGTFEFEVLPKALKIIVPQR